MTNKAVKKPPPLAGQVGTKNREFSLFYMLIYCVPKQDPMRILILLPLIISLSATAQWKSFIMSPRGDTLNRVDQKGFKQGPWVVHQDELRGEQGYDEQGYFVDDKN